MKTKFTNYISVFILPLIVFALSPGAFAQTEVNTNGDFSLSDVGQTSDIQNWNLEGTDYADFEIVADPDDDSNKLMKVTITNIEGVGNAWDIQLVHIGIPVEEGSEYVVDLRIRYDNAGGGTAGATSLDAAGDYPARYGVDISSGDWEVVSLDAFTATETDNIYAGIHFGAATHANGDIIYVDYLSVKKVEDEPEPEAVVVNINGDFSESDVGQTSDIQNWMLEGTNHADFEIVADPDNDGNNLMKVTITDISDLENSWDIQLVHTGIPVEEGNEYVVDLRVRYENSGGGTAGAVSVDAAGDYPARYGVDISSGDWETVSLAEFTATETDNIYVGVHLGAATHAVGDVIYVDYLNVSNLDAEPEPEPEAVVVNINGDFSESEVGQTSDIQNWMLEGTNHADFEIVADPDNDGNNLMKVTITDISDLENSWDIQLVHTGIPVEEGNEYVVDLRVRYENSGGGTAGAVSVDAAGDYPARYGVDISSGDWETVSLDEFTATETDNIYVGVHLGAATHAVGDVIYVDYLYVKNMDGVADDPEEPEEPGLPFPEPPFDFGQIVNYNGSFEHSNIGDTKDDIVAWTISSSDGSATEIVADDDAEGGKALKYSMSWNGSANWYNNEAVNGTHNVVEGETYEAVAVLKADQDGRVVRFYASMPESGSYERVGGWDTPETELTSEWTEYSFKYTATAKNETHGMRIGIEINNEANDGGEIYIDKIIVSKVLGTATEEVDELPLVYSLDQNYPNPFNPTTNITYSIPNASHVTLEVFNMLGQKVMTLVDNQQTAGVKQVVFDARNLASGVYLYRISANNFIQTRRMTIIK